MGNKLGVLDLICLRVCYLFCHLVEQLLQLGSCGQSERTRDLSGFEKPELLGFTHKGRSRKQKSLCLQLQSACATHKGQFLPLVWIQMRNRASNWFGLTSVSPGAITNTMLQLPAPTHIRDTVHLVLGEYLSTHVFITTTQFQLSKDVNVALHPWLWRNGEV